MKTTASSSHEVGPDPVSQHHSGCSRTRLRPLDAHIAEVHVSMIIQHAACDVQEVVHPLVLVADSARGVGTEARLVGIDGDRVALVEGGEFFVDVFTEHHFGHEAMFRRTSHGVIFWWLTQHAGEVPTPRPICVDGKVETLRAKPEANRVSRTDGRVSPAGTYEAKCTTVAIPELQAGEWFIPSWLYTAVSDAIFEALQKGNLSCFSTFLVLILVGETQLFT